MNWQDTVWWMMAGLFITYVVGSFLWHMSELLVRPLYIPSEEIERLVSEMMQRDPKNPHEPALVEESAAWYRSNTYEQGKWRRVRKEIMRMSDKGNFTQSHPP